MELGHLLGFLKMDVTKQEEEKSHEDMRSDIG